MTYFDFELTHCPVELSLDLLNFPAVGDDGDSQTKKNFGCFYCIVVPTISNPLLRILIAALTSLL